jgi:2-amino-4-hydroxy-6-hydroxymethyldihydropteridine diphosphokinase
MILIAIGANMAGPWGAPRQTVARAARELDKGSLRLRAISQFIETSPFGRPNQPNFVNAVASIDTYLPPEALLARLHAIERAAGRRRALRWGPRTLDLDLLDYHGLLRGAPKSGATLNSLMLPHPGIAERIFVLAPIAEIAPRWRHPLLNMTASQLLRRKRRRAGEGGVVQARAATWSRREKGQGD